MLISERPCVSTRDLSQGGGGCFSFETVRCEQTCVCCDSGDTQPLLLLSRAPNEVITVRQTGVTLTFDLIPPRTVMSRTPPPHLPAIVPAPLSPHWVLACRAVMQVASVCGNQGGLMSFNEIDVEPPANVPAFVRQDPAAACQPPC